MRTFSISDFKAHALSIIDAVAKTGERVAVAKRGAPLVYVIPYAAPDQTPRPGKLEGTLVREGDLVKPLGARAWSAPSDRSAKGAGKGAAK